MTATLIMVYNFKSQNEVIPVYLKYLPLGSARLSRNIEKVKFKIILY